MDADYREMTRTEKAIRHREYLKEMREERKKNHQCTNCGAQIPENDRHVMCEACRDAAKKARKAKADAWKAAGLCSRCGGPIGETERRAWGMLGECKACRDKYRDLQSIYERKTCANCGRQFSRHKTEMSSVCPDCRWKMRMIAKGIALQRKEREDEIRRVEENITRLRGGIQAFAMRSHPCYTCVFATSIDEGRRLFLPHCGAGCLTGRLQRMKKEK